MAKAVTLSRPAYIY